MGQLVDERVDEFIIEQQREHADICVEQNRQALQTTLRTMSEQKFGKLAERCGSADELRGRMREMLPRVFGAMVNAMQSPTKRRISKALKVANIPLAQTTGLKWAWH